MDQSYKLLKTCFSNTLISKYLYLKITKIFKKISIKIIS